MSNIRLHPPSPLSSELQCNTESTTVQDNDENVNTLLSVPDYRADPITLFVWWVFSWTKWTWMLCLFSFLGNSQNGWYEKSNITRTANADPDSIVRHHLECYFSRSRAGVRISIGDISCKRYREDIGIESSISSIDDIFIEVFC